MTEQKESPNCLVKKKKTYHEPSPVHAFYNAYGFMAVIFGPFRSGYLLLSLILWRKTTDQNLLATHFSDLKPDKLF